MSSMNMSSTSDLDYDQLSENVNLEELADQVQQQVEDSRFAEAASEFLISLAQADEETRQQISSSLDIQNFSVTSMPSYSAQLADDSGPEIDVKAKISSKLKHYTGAGMRCEVTVTSDIDPLHIIGYGFKFNSNDFDYYISGKAACTSKNDITQTKKVPGVPVLSGLEGVNDYASDPLN